MIDPLKLSELFNAQFREPFGYPYPESDEQIVSLEFAKELKQHGFKFPTYYYWVDSIDIPYVKSGLKRVNLNSRRMNHNKYDEFIYSAPTKKQVLKFIRKL